MVIDEETKAEVIAAQNDLVRKALANPNVFKAVKAQALKFRFVWTPGITVPEHCNIATWHYSAFSDDPILRSRAAYTDAILPLRIGKIRNLVEEHKSRNVVFYGMRYEPQWRQIAGAEFVDQNGVRVAQAGGISYISTLHPTARLKGIGAIHSYWDTVGSALKNTKQTSQFH